MRKAVIKGTVFLASSFMVAACNDSSGAQANAADPAALPPASSEVAKPPASFGKTEKVLVEQISCRQPPQAGVVISAMLRNKLIYATDDGGDGIVLFVPVRPMTFLGHEVVRLSGWQANPAGGAMEPFGRGPGTAPPNFFSITVKATVEQLRGQLASTGMAEARYEPDYSQSAWDESRGAFKQDDSENILWPRRLVPGAEIELGDNDLATNQVDGAVTISCTADVIDFEREIDAQIGAN